MRHRNSIGIVHAALAIAALVVAPRAMTADLGYGTTRVVESDAVHPLSAQVSGGSLLVLDVAAHRIAIAPLPADGPPTGWRYIGEQPDRALPQALASPQGMAMDPSGRRLYVADTGKNRVVSFVYDESAGSWSFDTAFAPRAPGGLLRPRDVAVGTDGSVYVLDAGNQRVLRADGAGASTWRVFATGTDWRNPFGLAVDRTGDVWLADTGNHRIVRLRTTGTSSAFGRWGGRDAELRSPRDVAVLDDGSVLVADTHNHRVAVFDAEGVLQRSLTSAPVLGQAERIAVTADGRIVVTDSQNGWVVIWPGPANAGAAGPVTFDGYLRDDEGDVGDPSYRPAERRSPDVLVRRRADLDQTRADRVGLHLIGDDVPVYGQPNHLYFEVHNRGSEPLADAAIGVWITDASGAFPPFPSPGWRSDDLYQWWRSEGENRPGNLLEAAFVPARGAEDGHAVFGPLVWMPRASEPPGCDDAVYLMMRLVHPAQEIPELASITEQLDTNDVAVRRLPVVASECLPERDRYEQNDYWDTRATVAERWTHLAARCPREVTRALEKTYPDFECPGIFEDGAGPRSAEEIWTLEVEDLSLHSTTDRDFLSIELPAMDDPQWGLHDINPEAIRRLRRDSPSYEPEPMPECGAVQREEFGPTGRDNTIWVNVSTELVITAVPVANAVARDPIDPRGEALRIYRDGEMEPTLGGVVPLVKRIACPQEVEDLASVALSFGERFVSGTDTFEPRPLEALGGYELSVSYLSSIRRGIPDWAASANDERGVRQIPCLLRPRGSGFPGFGAAGLGVGGPGPLLGQRFPGCGGIGEGLIDLLLQHPQTPGLVDCIADGRGCFELSEFAWAHEAAGLELFFASTNPLQITLLDQAGETIAESRAMQVSGEQAPSGGLLRYALSLPSLASGDYFLGIRGSPGTIQMSYQISTPGKSSGASARRWISWAAVTALLLAALAVVALRARRIR